MVAGGEPPAHLDGSLPGDFGQVPINVWFCSKKLGLEAFTEQHAHAYWLPCRFDPLGLGGDPERLKWFAESERIHSRWAMLAVAGILVQVGTFSSDHCSRGLSMSK